MKTVLMILSSLWLTIISWTSHAATYKISCDYGVKETITYPDSFAVDSSVAVDTSAAIGSLIGTKKTVKLRYKGGAAQLELLMKPAGALVSGVTYNGYFVYATNLAGVGYALWIESSDPTSITEKVDAVTGIWGGMYNAGDPSTVTMAYALVKTANTVAAGTLSGIAVDSSGSNVWCNSTPPATGVNAITWGTATVINKGCTPVNTTINVPLGTALNASFKGIGSTANAQSFNIDIICSAASKVSLTLAPGGSGAYDVSKGIINLDAASSGTKASGVGIQMLYNKTPVTLNTALSVGTSTAGGTVSVPLTAQYYQTTTKVTGGTANGTATFTITYN